MEGITIATFLTVIGLYGYAIYGTIILAKILREIQSELSELRRDIRRN